MCFFIKRKPKKGNSDNALNQEPEVLPATTAVLNMDKLPDSSVDKRLDQTQREDHVADIHARLRTRRTKKNKQLAANIDAKKRRLELEKTQKALGRKPNTMLVDRLIERTKRVESSNKEEKSKMSSSTSKASDIVLSYRARRKKDEDTEYHLRCDKKKPSQSTPIAVKTPEVAKCNTPIEPEEEFVENDEVEDEPNEINFMFNYKEIYYVCHDMIRTLLSSDLGEITGDCADSVDETKWNPFGPLSELEAREHFTCQILRRNTFLSNSLSMPTIDEKKNTKAPGEPAPSKVVVKTQPMDLSRLASLSHESSLATAPSQLSSKKAVVGSSRQLDRKKHSPSIKKKATSHNS